MDHLFKHIYLTQKSAQAFFKSELLHVQDLGDIAQELLLPPILVLDADGKLESANHVDVWMAAISEEHI